MDSETAMSILENKKACVMRADKCDRGCAKCKLVKPDSEILEALDMGIKAIRNGSLVDQIREFVKEENYLGKR